MTDTKHHGLDLEAATSFNSHNAANVSGWYRSGLPVKAIGAFPGLGADALGDKAAQETFAKAVFAAQQALFPGSPDDWDGMLGSQTYAALCDHYDDVRPTDRHVLHYGRRLKMPPEGAEIRTYKHPQGLVFTAGFSPNRQAKADVRRIVLHWSATTSIRACHTALVNRGLSSHFGVGLDEDRVVRVYQWLDNGHEGWHAGAVGNPSSIGIDICSTPVVDYKAGLEKRGHVVQIVDNPSKRGDKKVLTLDSRIAQATAQLVRGLCAAYGIPLKGPNGKKADGTWWDGVLTPDEVKNFRGVLGHAQISSGKWDILPYWAAIFDGVLTC